MPLTTQPQYESRFRKYVYPVSRQLRPALLAAALLFSGSCLAQGPQSQSSYVDSLPDAPSQDVPSKPDQQQPAAQSTPPKSQHDEAAEDLKKEEKQRILGIMPDFNMIDKANAVPLSPKQKFHLFFKSSTDPYQFGLAAIVAGFSQARNTFPGYGQGAEGYFKRFGASYADAFDGNFWGNAVLPIVLKEDPRYFRKGTGSVGSRILHAAVSTVWCRRDNGTWGPNYANVAGNIIGGAISLSYYPESDRDPDLVFSNALTVTAEGAIGAQLVEFWPDVIAHHNRKKQEKAAAQAAKDAAAAQQSH